MKMCTPFESLRVPVKKVVSYCNLTTLPLTSHSKSQLMSILREMGCGHSISSVTGRFSMETGRQGVNTTREQGPALAAIKVRGMAKVVPHGMRS